MTHPNDTREGPNPSGLCQCGCGQRTPLAPYNHQCGWVKGKPTSFIKGHNNRKSPVEYLPEDRGYETPCWIWQRFIQPDGYGRCVVQTENGRKSKSAHIMVWERHRGPVPAGLELDHLCRVRACVNPDHLEPVTKTENQRRSPRCKLNASLVAEMRALRAEGWTLVRLAERFHVSVPVVSKVCRYELWV